MKTGCWCFPLAITPNCSCFSFEDQYNRLRPSCLAVFGAAALWMISDLQEYLGKGEQGNVCAEFQEGF